MKDFTKIPARQPKPTPAPQTEDKQYFIKCNLVKSVERSKPVVDAILDWLLSISGGVSKKDFQTQLCKLDADDAKALKQLADSKGKRTLKQVPREIPPKLLTDILTALATYKMVAIEMAAGRKAIDAFLDSLPNTNGVYILDMNELVLEYVDYQHRGKAGEIINQATRADILVIEGLEKPISLPYHLRDTLYQLAAVRTKSEDKYTLSTYNYTHTWFIPEFAKLFTHFSI